MAKPQIVVIPGAWHKPEEYLDRVNSRLGAAGYTVHARQMPATGNPNPPKDLSEDIALAQSLVEEAIGEGNDVVVIAHSWGGIVGGSAMAGYGKRQREAEGKKGGVISLGYMAAFILPEGASLMDAVGHQRPYWWTIDEAKGIVLPNDPKVFYNDLPEDEQKHWFSLIQPHSVGTMHAGCTAASWKEIPTFYLVCTKDLAIPEFGQDAMIKAAKEAGADIDVTRLDCGHSPFLSRPDETVAWIKKVAGEKV